MVFSITPTFMGRFVEVQHHMLIPGRTSAMRFVRIGGTAFNLIGVHTYLPLVMRDTARFLARLKERVDECKQEAIFMVGEIVPLLERRKMCV